MPIFDVYLVPCVTVKVPAIIAGSLSEAIEQAEAIADLQHLFEQTDGAGVEFVAWNEEFSHFLIDELTLAGDDDRGEGQFLNTQYEPVQYGHTTGVLLHLLDAGEIIHEFGPYRHIAINHDRLICMLWQESDGIDQFTLVAGGFVHQHQVYAHWAVAAIEIPDHVGLPRRLFTRWQVMQPERDV